MEARAAAALLGAAIQPDHRPVRDQAAALIDTALDHLRPDASQPLP